MSSTVCFLVSKNGPQEKSLIEDHSVTSSVGEVTSSDTTTALVEQTAASHDKVGGVTLQGTCHSSLRPIHWKAVEQYFTVVLFVNPLTPRVKPWMIQSFLTFDSMDRTV